MSGGQPGVLLDAGPYALNSTGVGGIGLRIAEFAETLGTRFRVQVAVADPADAIPVGDAAVVPLRSWAKLLDDCAAVFFFDLADRRRMEEAVAARRLVIVENAPPIEHLEYPSVRGCADPAAVHQGMVAAYRRQLEIAHHFVCRSAVERATLIGNLCLAGRLTPADVDRSRTLDHLVSLVPLGFSADSERRAAAAQPVHLADVLWTGGIWSYLDPLALVDALAVCRADGSALTGAFLYAAAQPDNAELVARVRARVAEHGLRDAVRLCAEPVRHQDRDAIVKGARVLVCAARPGVENETCVRLRIRDSRLYGVPMIVDSYGPTAYELARDGLGSAVAEVTAENLANKLRATVASGRVGKARAGRSEYRYDRTMRAFMRWLETELR